MAEKDIEFIAANDCIVDILESYMEFMNWIEKEKPAFYKVVNMMKVKKQLWQPILDTCKEKQLEIMENNNAN